MGSDHRSPRARHRFGFSGPPARQNKERVTTDDILDNLTRQAELRQKLGQRDALRIEEIAEPDDLDQFRGLNPEPLSAPKKAGNRSFARLAFVFMLLCGLTVVWLYSLLTKPFDIASLAGIVRKSGIQSIFANQAQLGIIAIAGIAIALWIRRRRGSRVQILCA